MRAPVLAIGDGALGFWSAVREVFPQARPQRCRFHKIASVLGALPKSAHPGARKALAEIWNAEDKNHAGAAVKAFAAACGPSSPGPPPRSPRMRRNCWRFFGCPAEHWVHLRTNPIESTSPRSGCGRRSPRATGPRPPHLAMAFKLTESAQRRWRMVSAPHLVALVRAGATFANG